MASQIDSRMTAQDIGRPWQHYAKEELDRLYNARGTVGDIEPITALYAQGSAKARSSLPCALDVPYGEHPDETLDIFPARQPGAPVYFFVHGGYWRMLSKNESSFMAPAFVEAGATVVSINYQLAPAASLDEIVRQCRAALAWVHRHIAQYNGDPDQLHIGGSSAGGHLVGMLLAKGWHEAFGVPVDVVKSASPISGLFELTPLIGTHVNAWAKLDEESALRNSPLFHLPDHGCPLIVSYGTTETSEFVRQTRDYMGAWQARGYEAACVDMPGTNHFDIILALADPRSALTRAIFEAMSLG